MRTPRPQIREAVLTAAERQFRAQGFRAASLEQIARDAGLTKGAVYSNFRGKDGLFIAVLERHVAGAIVRYQSGLEGGAKADRIDALASFLAQAALDDAPWSAAFAEFALHATRSPPVSRALAEVRTRLRREVVDLLRPIVDGGAASDERLEHAAILFIALGNGLTLESMSDRSRVNKALYKEALERLLA